jgi:pyruvate dehydrogenase E1 component
MYCFRAAPGAAAPIRLVGSGAILREVIAAGDLLRDDWGVASEIWSATSFSELDRDARATARWNRLHPTEPARTSHVAQCLGGTAPVIAATDYVRAYPQLIATHVPARMVTLGTDGFGRSDTRARLRRFFEIDRHQIVLAALDALAQDGRIGRDLPLAAITRYGIDPDAPAPWSV